MSIIHYDQDQTTQPPVVQSTELARYAPSQIVPAEHAPAPSAIGRAFRGLRNLTITAGVFFAGLVVANAVLPHDYKPAVLIGRFQRDMIIEENDGVLDKESRDADAETAGQMDRACLWSGVVAALANRYQLDGIQNGAMAFAGATCGMSQQLRANHFR